jgi:RNA polymerase sigma-70 factor (ECF subfamily)
VTITEPDLQPDSADPQTERWDAIAQQRPFLLRLARLQLTSIADAEDAVQDTMVAALKGWDGFHQKSGLRSWLTGILRHKIVDAIRQKRFEIAPSHGAEIDDAAGGIDGLFTSEDAWHPDVFVDTVCGETHMAQRQLLDIVELCMRRLPEENARIFLMREYLGLELSEIQQSCAISPGNLRVMLYRARMRLRECAVRGWGELN